MAKKKTSKKNNKHKHTFLKKIARGIYYFISLIYNLLDKAIITPIAKFLLLITKPLKNVSKSLDRLLNNKSVLITLSLIVALIAFFNYDNLAERLMNNSADILYNQKVTALYNEEAYVIEKLPEKVDITLIGRKSALYLAKQFSNEEVVVDLRGLKPGTHEVKLKYTGAVSSVEYKVNPETATVVIREKVSESRKITKEILYEDSLDSRYTISDITFNRDEVYVKGAEYMLEKISTVKALVDVRQITNPTVGTTTLKEIPLVAYDENGAKLDVEIVPATVDATIKITSPSKEVPLRVIPEGEVEFGKAIDTVTLSKEKVTIYGDESVLDKISYVPVNINVEGIKKATEFNVNLSLPSGVRQMSTRSVVVKVTLAAQSEKNISNVSIATRNLGSGLTAKAASKSDSLATIIVKGSSSSIKNVKAENITAYVDLQGLGKGRHNVEVKVTGDDLTLSYTPKTKTVTIIIE